MIRFTLPAMFLSCLILVTGCSSQAIVGKVVAGPKSAVMVVEADDPRLAGPPIEGAYVEFVLDPDKGNRQALGSVHVDYNGSFRFPVDAMGAGFLEYQLLVIGRAPKRSPAMTTIPMPKSGKRLLVILAPGEDRAPRTTDPIRDSMQEADHWLR